MEAHKSFHQDLHSRRCSAENLSSMIDTTEAADLCSAVFFIGTKEGQKQMVAGGGTRQLPKIILVRVFNQKIRRMKNEDHS